jgi:hypothetical protein
MLKRALRARGHALCAPQRRTMSLPAHTRPRLCRTTEVFFEEYHEHRSAVGLQSRPTQ